MTHRGNRNERSQERSENNHRNKLEKLYAFLFGVLVTAFVILGVGYVVAVEYDLIPKFKTEAMNQLLRWLWLIPVLLSFRLFERAWPSKPTPSTSWRPWGRKPVEEPASSPTGATQ